jgi:thiol:disulfide interchange protein DsbC
MSKPVVAAALLLASVLSPAAFADEAKVRAAITTLVPQAQIDSISESVLPGFSEVVLGGQVVYVSDDGKYVVSGAVFDVTTKSNLTENRYADIRREALAKVPADKRIIFPAKNEKFKVTVFTDIDCGYCRHLHQQVAGYNDAGITIEYLFFPRSGPGTESWNKAVAVWCADDNRAAMTAAKNGETIEMNTECSNPVNDDFELGKQIGVSGTPAVITADGTQIGGYMEPPQMLARLEQLAAAKPKN